MVQCPICSRSVSSSSINAHLDSGCQEHLDESSPGATIAAAAPVTLGIKTPRNDKFAAFFRPTQASATRGFNGAVEYSDANAHATERQYAATQTTPVRVKAEDVSAASVSTQVTPAGGVGIKRQRGDDEHMSPSFIAAAATAAQPPPAKRHKPDALASAAPLAERMRPRTLDDVCGQDLVGPNGLLRALIESNQVPSMILWGGPGTGKTTIARLIASTSSARFVEINSTSTGVGECKRIFTEARNELSLTGRKTIVFCDEIHRFSKSQQDVFLAPVEAGTVTLIGATTENPGFKVIGALMSRCQVFTLEPLGEEDVEKILRRALQDLPASTDPPTVIPALIDDAFLAYLATASAGDARTALNLLSLSLSLSSSQPHLTMPELKKALTTTLLHDRTGDSHYNHISALHKSIRGSDASAALYYLARMLTAGEDAVYIARRLIVIASEDVGLADNSMLSLATATYQAVEKVGIPEARINLAHCVSALALAPKSVRAYRGYSAAEKCVKETGAGSVQVPVHLRQAPTRLLREMGCGRDYKYNPAYKGGRVRQAYLPEELADRVFLGDEDLGSDVDPDLEEEDVPPEIVSDCKASTLTNDVAKMAEAVGNAISKTDSRGTINGKTSVWEPGGDIEIDEWEA